MIIHNHPAGGFTQFSTGIKTNGMGEDMTDFSAGEITGEDTVLVRRDDLKKAILFIDQVIASANACGGTFTGPEWYNRLFAAKEKTT